MSYQRFSDEELEICRNTDMVRMCETLGYHVKVGPKYSQIKEMDSLQIKNRRTFVRYSSGVGGSCIDFLTEIEGMDWKAAVNWLLDFNGVSHTEYTENTATNNTTPGIWFSVSVDENGKVTVTEKEKPKARFQTEETEPEVIPFVLPEKTNPTRVTAYLHKTRGISMDTINWMLEKGVVYESADTHNVVFVGLDKDSTARHASLRGTYTTEGQKAFKGVVTGSDARYSFNIVNPNNNVLVVTEAPIDAMSIFDMAKEYQEDNPRNFLALTGVHDKALERFLTDYGHIKEIVLSLDADEAGREGCRKIIEKYTTGEWAEKKMTFFRDEPMLDFKDWNEYLVHVRKQEQGGGGIGI